METKKLSQLASKGDMSGMYGNGGYHHKKMMTGYSKKGHNGWTHVYNGDPCGDPCADPCGNGYGWGWGNGWASAFVWFVIIAVIIWFILYSTKPEFVRKKAPDGTVTEEVDNGKALIWAIVIAIIIVVLIKLFMYSSW